MAAASRKRFFFFGSSDFQRVAISVNTFFESLCSSLILEYTSFTYKLYAVGVVLTCPL